MNELKGCTVPQMMLNDTAEELLEQIAKAQTITYIVEGRLFCTDQCAAETAQQPSNLQSRIEKALRDVRSLNNSLESIQVRV